VYVIQISFPSLRGDVWFISSVFRSTFTRRLGRVDEVTIVYVFIQCVQVQDKLFKRYV